MSMADKAKLQNWVKASISLRYVKDGLANFANNKADSLKEDIYKNVEIKSKAAVQTSCKTCTYNSVKNAKKSHGAKYLMSCNICNHWLSQIQNYAYANHKLEWSNCDPKLWAKRSWEIAKVFMGYGCGGSRNANDIDCSNLMTMMLGCTYFHKFISNLQSLQEVKDIRNSIMHSNSLQLTDADMKKNLNKMVEILEDSKYLKTDIDCQEAVIKIKQLRDSTIIITMEDEYDELVRLMNEIQNKNGELHKKNVMINIDVEQMLKTQETFSKSHQEMEKKLTENMETITARQAKYKGLLDTIQTLDLPDINKRLKMSIDQLNVFKDDTMDNFKRLQQKVGVMNLRQKQLEQKQDISEQKMESMEQRQNKIEAKMKTQKQAKHKVETAETYEEKVLKLQRHLIKLYENDHSAIPVYPLRPNLTKELDIMFVRQEMIEKNPRGPKIPQPDINDRLEHTRGQEVIETLKEVFFKETKLCKNIYVTGDAGVGKSTFCRYIVNMWIKTQTGKNVQSLRASDVETLKQFPLLFYVQLRGVMLGTETDTFASLIKTQLNLDNDLKDFLKEENCLIICDSLDEIASGLPSRGGFNKSTILTTSRPWKLETLREDIEGKAIDRQIEIVCIGENSAETLVKNILPVLAQESASDLDKNYQSFLKEMKDMGLVSFLRIPVLLVQILCLWYEDNLEVGESQYSIYKKLVHYQIMIFVKKSKNCAQLSTGNYKLLLCKSNTCQCRTFSDILLKVGKLAFNALVSKNRQYQLVFDHNTTDIHGLCEQDVEICLRIGILSQHKLFGKLTEEPKKFMSFVHKTNQEFFASLYLSYKVPKSDIKSVLKTAIGNLDRMLELEKLLIFVSGLNPEMGRKMAHLLLKAADQDPRIQNYRQTARWESSYIELVSNIQTAILAARAECKLNQHQQQFHLDDVRVIVNDEEDNMSRVLSCLPAGSLVTSISMLCSINNRLSTDGVISRTNPSRLQKVDLFCCTISGDSLSQVVPNSLCALYLFRVRMSHAALKSLGSRRSAAMKLRWVEMRALECETHGILDVKRCTPLSLDFSSHVGLEKLVIGGCDMSSCRMAPGMRKLEKVYLHLVVTTAAILKQLVDSLRRNNVKVNLEGVTIRHEAGVASPADILDGIRQSCRVEIDDVRRKKNGDLFVYFVFYKYRSRSRGICVNS